MTTAHHLSVITNSCVKRPVNPKTGHIVTSTDRVTNLHHTWHGGEDEFGSDLENFPGEREDTVLHLEQGSVNGTTRLFNKTDTMLDNMTDLDGLDEDEFYHRLLELKEEHKKTLEMCEQLYQEKVLTPQRSEHGTDFSSPGKSPGQDLDLSARYSIGASSGIGVLNHSRDSMNRSFDRSVRDHVRDTSASSKPPTGRPPSSHGRPQSAKTRSPASTLKPAGRAWGEFSFDETYWKPPSSTSTSEVELSDDEHSARRALFNSTHFDHSYSNGVRKSPVSSPNNTRRSVTSRIEDMWDDFSVEDYAPPRTRPRSASLSRLSSASRDKEKSAEDWRNKITVPKPFKMTLRETKKQKTPSKTLQEFEEQRRQKEEEEEIECQKKFKATPIPAHVYMPLFDEIMEEKESRRRIVKEHCEEMLKSQEKPFKFMKREEEKKKYRNQVRTDPLASEDQKKKTTFKARPYPEHIFEDNLEEQMKEEEQYRRIKMQMRAEELLRSSSLPPNMAARGEVYFKGKSRQKSHAERAKKAGIFIEERFHPQVNDTIPDFEELHRQFQRNLAVRKGEREATVCKPFNLRTSRIPSQKHKVYEDIQKDEDTLRENRWPFQNPRARPLSGSSALTRSMSGSLDSIPTKMTAAAELRKSTTKSRMRQQMEIDLRQLELERQRRRKERDMKKVISKKAAASDNSVALNKTSKEKLREYRESEKIRMEEYRQQLHEMMDRVDKRPLLFERTAQNNAKMRAEKKYRETLLRTGVDEDYVLRHGSTADTLDSYRDGTDDEDEDLSYSRNTQPASHRSGTPFDDDEQNDFSHGSAGKSQSYKKSYSQDFDDPMSDDKTDEGSDIEEEILDD